MGSVQNLSDTEGRKKLKEMAEDINMCMFCTHVENLPFDTRPMGTLKVDDDGNFWFFSQRSSNKNKEIKNDDVVQLIYAKNSDTHFLTVTGTATVSRDRKMIDELWIPLAKAWFPEGKDDPELSVIKVTPTDAYYWDTKHGKMINLLKIAAAAITKNPMDDGVEGTIKIH